MTLTLFSNGAHITTTTVWPRHAINALFVIPILISRVSAEEEENKKDSNMQKKKVDMDKILTCVYFGIICITVISTVLYFYILDRLKEPEERQQTREQTEKEVNLLLENLKTQFRTFRHFPIKWRGMKPYYTHYILSWMFLVLLITGLLLVILGLCLRTDGHEQLVRVSTFIFIASFNALFMTRQHLYYVRRMHLTDTAAYHHLVMDTTVYDDYDRTWANWLQIIILIFEFFQLLSFPVRDLLTTISTVQNTGDLDNKDTWIASFVMSIVTLFTDISSKFYIIQFWFLCGITVVAVVIALGIHLYNNRSGKKSFRPITLTWLTYIVPVVSLLYLPILVMLVSSASCLSKLGTVDQHMASSGILHCDSPSISKPLYLLCTFVAYIMAYVILTVFLTSFDRIPIKGEIQFKSMGTAFIKNMSLLLSIDFLLVENKFNHIRSIISLIIMISMVCFNIHVQPCYVRKINFWRSYIFCAILWTVLIVAIFTNDETTLGKINWIAIIVTIASGIVILLGVYIIIWFLRLKFDKMLEKNRLLQQSQNINSDQNHSRDYDSDFGSWYLHSFKTPTTTAAAITTNTTTASTIDKPNVISK